MVPPLHPSEFVSLPVCPITVAPFSNLQNDIDLQNINKLWSSYFETFQKSTLLSCRLNCFPTSMCVCPTVIFSIDWYYTHLHVPLFHCKLETYLTSKVSNFLIEKGQELITVTGCISTLFTILATWALDSKYCNFQITISMY